MWLHQKVLHEVAIEIMVNIFVNTSILHSGSISLRVGPTQTPREFFLSRVFSLIRPILFIFYLL